MTDLKTSHLAKLQADFQAYLYDDVKGAAFKEQIINDQKVGAKSALAFITMLTVCVLLKRSPMPIPSSKRY